MTSAPDNPASLVFALRSTWALLLGFGILMLGDGLQSTLLAVRADQEGFTATITGLIMSSFYAGFLSGSVLTPKIMARVGHIRVFAALAALASASILIHAVFVSISVWIVLRLISGFCFAGLYVVAESWLNESSTNETRGKVLSLYMLITYISVGIGQLLLNLADPGDYLLFILTSVLISIAVVPLLLSATALPRYEESVEIKIRELAAICPLGIAGIFIEGMVTATFFALGPVYGQRIGLDIEGISWFMAAAIAGTLVLQWPIGALSDRFDRRMILAILSFLAMVSAFSCVYFTWSSLTLFVSVGIFGGLAFPLYSVCIAYTNDHLKPNQMVAASGVLVLAGGMGAVIGPVAVASILDFFGNDSFFWSMGIAYLLVGLFALYRMTRRASLASMKHSTLTPTAMHPSSAVIESIQQHAKEEALSHKQRS